MDPATALMIYGGIKAVKGFGQAAGLWGQAPKRKQSQFYQPYVDYWKRVGEEGMYSQATQKQMLSQVTQPMQELANRTKSVVSGNIERQGLGGSLINRYATADTDRDVLYNVARTSKEIALKNEMTKNLAPGKLYQAGETEAMRQYQNRLAYTQARNQGWDMGIEGIGSALTAWASGQPMSENQMMQSIQKLFLTPGAFEKLSDQQIELMTQFITDYLDKQK